MQNRMKRPADGGVASPSLKRRKASVLSVTSATPSNHPLRQTSFPPDESQAATPRSPSVDTASLVSGSHVSGAPKQRRKRRTKAEIAAEAAAREAGRSPSASVVGGKRAGTVVSGASGTAGGGRGGKRGMTEEQGEEEEDDSGPVIVKKNEQQRTEERIKEQKMRALLQRAMNPDQELRFHMLRGAKLQDATVRRVGRFIAPTLTSLPHALDAAR
jgi:transcription initiation factor TFIID subunit 11